MANGKDTTTTQPEPTESVGAYFREVFKKKPQLIQVRSNDEVLEQWLKDYSQESGMSPENAQLTMRASTSAELGVKEATSMIKLLETLEDLDDVQNVYSNADISDDVLAQI